ncbi:MAG: hypothetical protein LQ339_005302 [Xanthoria mediterranea]|nr:MAG: hypothetical protein LQ339_005302 [Xanthoria mediterranea]
MEEIAELWMLRPAVASNAVDDHDPSRCLDVRLASGGCRTAAVILSKKPGGRASGVHEVGAPTRIRAMSSRSTVWSVFSLFEWAAGIEYSAVGHVCSLGVRADQIERARRLIHASLNPVRRCSRHGRWRQGRSLVETGCAPVRFGEEGKITDQQPLSACVAEPLVIGASIPGSSSRLAFKSGNTSAPA